MTTRRYASPRSSGGCSIGSSAQRAEEEACRGVSASVRCGAALQQGRRRVGQGKPGQLLVLSSNARFNCSALLRHGIHEHGLSDCLSPDGYVPLARVLALRCFAGVLVTQVQEVVKANDKQRFRLKRSSDDCGFLIRANQGHSLGEGLDDDALLEKMVVAQGVRILAVHGTYYTAWPAIRSEGLKRMQRRHIHLAEGLDATSGLRRSCELAIWVDVTAAAADGVIFYRSANGVILTSGEGGDGVLPPRYFACAMDQATGEELPLRP